MRWPPALLLAAWLLATGACGVVWWMDAHFVLRQMAVAPPAHVVRESTFRSFTLTTRFPNGAQATESYYIVALVGAWPRQLWSIEPSATFARVAEAGAALYALTAAAPFLGLLAFVWQRSSRSFRHVLVLAAGVAPLIALEHFGSVVDAASAEHRSLHPMLRLFLHASPATWAARSAWSCLSVAAAASWYLEGRRARPSAVDPATFD